MSGGRTLVAALALLALALHPSPGAAKPAVVHQTTEAPDESYELRFIPTQNAPPGARGTMKITFRAASGETEVRFTVRHAFPNTLYTIWTVFNTLRWPLPDQGVEVPAESASRRPGFPGEGNGVSPLARLDDRFTSGMGIDPGASFVTDARGNGSVALVLDYDLVRGAPVSNGNLNTQCVPDPTGACRKTVRVTTTWLRTFIGEFWPWERARMCANYDPRADPDGPDVFPEELRHGMDARLWQCVDPASVNPATGRFVVRVPRFEVDHFRLAAHPDGLTHGFIGGNRTDHRIDLVGRWSDLVPVPVTKVDD